MAKLTIGVLGIGEVGSAIAEIFSTKFSVLKKELKYDQLKESKIEVLHVCLPYTTKFEKLVLEQAKKNKPDLIIIHSTVAPQTTAKIFLHSKTPTVHSPVMGTHPDLKNDILKFIKFIGPASERSQKLAEAHFKKVGIKTKTLQNSLETELGKLFDTTYYAWNIVFEKLMWQICDKTGVDFNNVYTEFNKVYNQGYQNSNPNVLRPILKHQPGPIGGHCLIPNAKILHSYLKTPLTTFLLEQNKKS